AGEVLGELLLSGGEERHGAPPRLPQQLVQRRLPRHREPDERRLEREPDERPDRQPDALPARVDRDDRNAAREAAEQRAELLPGFHRGRTLPYTVASFRNTYGRIPPWRTYSRSRGVSSRRVARNSLSSARTVTSRASPPETPVTENTSRPVSPSDSRLSPGRYWSGRIPIIRRFERWIRS